MKRRRLNLAAVALALALAAPAVVSAQTGNCYATPTSLTPTSWSTPIPKAVANAPRGALRLLKEYPLPGPANRFDYQSLDPVAGRLYINHMNAGRLVVFDIGAGKLVTEIPALARATGVLAVPSRHQVFVSAAGAHDVAIINDQTLAITTRVGGIGFPDGIAYVPGLEKVFVSDESGAADVAIELRTNAKGSTIALGGEAGNTHYDSVSHCILVAVQTRNQLVAIDPATEHIAARYDLAGSDHPHGFVIDEAGRLAFISCEGNAKLLVVDLRTMKVLATHTVGEGPDVLAWDASWRRLYVAAEGGVLSVFAADGSVLQPLGEYKAPHAHTVSVDSRTHRVYLPLESIDGAPVLRVLAPGAR
jgi:DNA-binding beta-propeller fold protein YncE